MKILKIFGLVVGIHVVAFMFVFAIPGCRSTSRHSPPPSASVQAERSSSRAEVAYPQNDAPSSEGQSPSSPLVEPALNPAPASPTPTVNFGLSSGSSSGQRSNPTRPGTPAVAGLHTGPMAPPSEMSPASTYVVVAGDSLSKISKKHNLSIKELAAANNLRMEAPIRLGQKLLIPGKVIPSSTMNGFQPTSQPAETLVYKVRPGDSLASIAKRAGTTQAAIRSLNRLKNDMVRSGQDLTLPAGAAASNLVSSPVEEASASSFRDDDGTVHHIVKPGENLGIIARHYGVKSGELAVANNIADPLKVRAGQDLIIPSSKSTSGGRAIAIPQPELRSPTVESTPATPSSPVSSPTDYSPIAPSTPPISAPTPPTIEVQEANPIATPKS